MATAGAGRGPGPERAWCRRLPPSGAVTLEADESAHLVRVRRAAVGDEVVLFDGRGVTRRARLAAADPRAAVLEVLGDAPDREPPRVTVIAASPPETARADLLVEGLAWLGVTRWVPLLCARTPPDREAMVRRRAARFERLAREAAKGNGRSRLLEVAEPANFADVLADATLGRVVLLDPDPAVPRLLDVLRGEVGATCCLVGPEGGFTADEVQAALTGGARVSSLGSTALRVELAALAAAAQSLGRT